MLNKNDPLIDSVKKVMEQNNKERAAVKAVNEKFRIHDRRALPHEKQGEWDAAYKKVLAEGVEALDEISSDLARRYIKKAEASEKKARGDLYKHSWLDMKDKRNGEGLPDASAKAAHHDLKVANKRESGISLAKGKLTGDQHKKWEKPKGKRNIAQVTKDTKVLTVKEEQLDELSKNTLQSYAASRLIQRWRTNTKDKKAVKKAIKAEPFIKKALSKKED